MRDAVDIAAWLRELALERYEEAFQENEIDAEILSKLTADDLKDIGVTIVGHRRKLLEAISALVEPALAPQPEERAPGEAAPKARPAEAERRQLTVLFCDLVGSTELSAQLLRLVGVACPRGPDPRGSQALSASRLIRPAFSARRTAVSLNPSWPASSRCLVMRISLVDQLSRTLATTL